MATVQSQRQLNSAIKGSATHTTSSPHLKKVTNWVIVSTTSSLFRLNENRAPSTDTSAMLCSLLNRHFSNKPAANISDPKHTLVRTLCKVYPHGQCGNLLRDLNSISISLKPQKGLKMKDKWEIWMGSSVDENSAHVQDLIMKAKTEVEKDQLKNTIVSSFIQQVGFFFWGGGGSLTNGGDKNKAPVPQTWHFSWAWASALHKDSQQHFIFYYHHFALFP